MVISNFQRKNVFRHILLEKWLGQMYKQGRTRTEGEVTIISKQQHPGTILVSTGTLCQWDLSDEEGNFASYTLGHENDTELQH